MSEKERFHMRQLHEEDLDQFNNLLRYAFQVTGNELLKTGWDEEEIRRAKIPILEQAYALGWFDGDTLASQIVIYDMQVNVYEEIFRMGGITGVTTYPEYAGRGLIHSLMKRCLEYMKEQKMTLSFLFPYSIPFYRKMGWEIVSDKMTFLIKDVQLPKRQQVPGIVKRVDLEHEDLKRVYRYFAVQKHGALIRDELSWAEYWRWETEDVIASIYYSEEGKPLGYLVYTIENEILYVKEMIYLNQEARIGIWNYITSHYSMINEAQGANYTGEPLAFLLEDSEITETIEPYIMARIVDVYEFMLLYPFQFIGEDLHVNFIVHDSMAEWNEGYFGLHWEDGQVCCVKEEDMPTVNVVELNIQILTTMLMGYKRPSYLYDNGKLEMEYYMVQILERLIPTGKAYFSDYF